MIIFEKTAYNRPCMEIYDFRCERCIMQPSGNASSPEIGEDGLPLDFD